MFIWSKIHLLIRSISFLDGFMAHAVAWLIKFTLWPFKVTKELPVSFISVLSDVFPCFANLTPFLLIFVPMLLIVFLQVILIAFLKRFSWLLLFSLYIVDVWSVGVSVFFDVCTFFISSRSIFGNSIFPFQNFNCFTIFTRSSSNWISLLLVEDFYYSSNHN